MSSSPAVRRYESSIYRAFGWEEFEIAAKDGPPAPAPAGSEAPPAMRMRLAAARSFAEQHGDASSEALLAGARALFVHAAKAGARTSDAIICAENAVREVDGDLPAARLTRGPVSKHAVGTGLAGGVHVDALGTVGSYSSGETCGRRHAAVELADEEPTLPDGCFDEDGHTWLDTFPEPLAAEHAS